MILLAAQKRQDDEELPDKREEVKEALDHLVDVVVEGDQTGQEPTTVVDFSAGYPEVVRVGSGDPAPFQ